MAGTTAVITPRLGTMDTAVEVVTVAHAAVAEAVGKRST
jgi:hypothetical protein